MTTVIAAFDPFSLIWLYFVIASLQPLFQRQWLMGQRRFALAAISRKRESTVITLIHRQESMSLFGFPLVRYIDIDDSEGVLRAIRDTPPGRGIEIILHTPGGLVLAAQQIAAALADHDGPVTAVIPHYAMSGGTLIALSADKVQLDSHAALGPVDPQLGEYPARSIVEASEQEGEHEDKTLIMADVGRKALTQVEAFTFSLLARHMDPQRARETARMMATGTWTHDHPLLATDLLALGVPVEVGVPDEERELMELYPQPRGRTPAVEYSPGPPAPTFPQRRSPQSLGREVKR
ncbi:MAG: SDH family Clp fold serine proteinase [Thermoleophilaceae bacterium]